MHSHAFRRLLLAGFCLSTTVAFSQDKVLVDPNLQSEVPTRTDNQTGKPAKKLPPKRETTLKKPVVPAAEKKPAEFLRLKKDRKGDPVALQTSIARYVYRNGKGNVFVDLVGAVHIGDGDYYEQLNDEFEQYDVLLYELVAPPDRRIPVPNEKDDDLFVMVRKVAQILFEFEMQLEGVDYTKKNFVHADLSPEEMAKKIKENGDSPATIILGMITDMLRQNNRAELNRTKRKKPLPQIDLMSVVRDPDGAMKLKRIMAEQMASSVLDVDEQSTMNRILVVDRNKATMEVLKRELAKGHKKIGIFYGAAHMPDFDKRLRLELDMTKQSERWVTAWDLKIKNKTRSEHLLKYVRIAEMLINYYEKSQGGRR